MMRFSGIKLFALMSLLLFAIAAWYFVSQRSQSNSPSIGSPTISSEVTNIRAVQTNPETGEIEYELTAQSLIQNTSGKDELKEVVMDWTPNSGQHYTIRADTATLEQATGDFVFKDGFILTRHANADNKEMILKGGALTGNTKSKLIASDAPLDVTQDGHQFNAQSMQGDLNTGDYQFNQITIAFNPVQRVDQALF